MLADLTAVITAQYTRVPLLRYTLLSYTMLYAGIAQYKPENKRNQYCVVSRQEASWKVARNNIWGDRTVLFFDCCGD